MVPDPTWVKALFAADPRRPRRRLDAATGELSPQRCDPDARAYNTRTGSGVGHQAVLALARNPHPGERVILAAFLNHPGRSDATAFTDKALELANRRPGGIAAAYVGALHAADMIRLLDNAITSIAKTRRGRARPPQGHPRRAPPPSPPPTPSGRCGTYPSPAPKPASGATKPAPPSSASRPQPRCRNPKQPQTTVKPPIRATNRANPLCGSRDRERKNFA